MDTPRLEVRCPFCRKRPLLAVCGRNEETGEPFVHVKTWKGDRLYTELVVVYGLVRIRCRDCRKWLKLTIRPAKVDVVSERLPDSITV